MSRQTQYEEDLLIETQEVEENKLVIFNDDVNTFDHVIRCLVEVCNHETLQAEQCTLIIHHNGKCAVKNGEYDDLAAMCTVLHDRGLTAEVQ